MATNGKKAEPPKKATDCRRNSKVRWPRCYGSGNRENQNMIATEKRGVTEKHSRNQNDPPHICISRREFQIMFLVFFVSSVYSVVQEVDVQAARRLP